MLIQKAPRLLVASLLALSLTGCMYHIKLDATDESARISVNGNPAGRGIVEHAVDAQYGYPQSFGVKVEPKNGKPYTLEIARELDVPRAVVNTAVSAGVGLAFLAGDMYYGRLSVSTLLILAYAPLSWLNSYYYKPYYDLEKAKQPTAP